MVIAAVAAGDAQGDVVRAVVARQGTHALLIARFADPDAAARVYAGLRNGEGAGRTTERDA